MRFIKQKEISARGCKYCTNKLVGKNGWIYACQKFECPYNELDGYKHYNDYLEANGMNFLPQFSKKDFEVELDKEVLV